VKRLLLLYFLLMTMCLVSCSRGDNGMKKSSLAQTAGTAPDFVLKDIEGKNVQLSQYRGKVVVVEFWATWCPPCKATIPGLIAVQEKYAGKGLVVLGVSIDEGDDLRSKLSAFSKEHKINYPVLLGSEEVSRAYGVMSIPATFLVGKDQKIISAYKGYVDDLENYISQQIDKNL
jgi:cytochrome c biogenesis protein CcmG/thiol:disulfide interchange protein DsbE